MVVVTCVEDPAEARTRAIAFLRADPVMHNFLIDRFGRDALEDPNVRYVITERDGVVCGFGRWSPIHDLLGLSGMDAAVAREAGIVLVDHLRPVDVGGPAEVVAAFVGGITERCDAAAHPTEGERIYELREIVEAGAPSGRLRAARADDVDQLIAFTAAFNEDLGVGHRAPTEDDIQTRVASGRYFVWDDGGVVSTCTHTNPSEGVVRIQGVFTPRALRGRGYAGACVRAVSAELLGHGYRPILYTDLANATSNALYRRMGYRVVSEQIRYRITY